MLIHSAGGGGGDWCRKMKVSLSLAFLLTSVEKIITHPALYSEARRLRTRRLAKIPDSALPSHGRPCSLNS